MTVAIYFWAFGAYLLVSVLLGAKETPNCMEVGDHMSILANRFVPFVCSATQSNVLLSAVSNNSLIAQL